MVYRKVRDCSESDGCREELIQPCDGRPPADCGQVPAKCGVASPAAGDRNAPSWEDLLRRYLRLLSSPDEGERWRPLWTLFIEHPWYQEQLSAIAKRLVRVQSLPQHWQQDVKQEVMLLLGEKLHRSPDLNFDPQRIGRHFSGWMATIIRRDCQRVLRDMRRMYPPRAELHENSAWTDETTVRDACLDFDTALRALDDPYGAVVVLSVQGYSVKEIAQAYGMSDRKTYRVLHHGMLVLERTLRADALEWDSHEYPRADEE